MADTQCGPSSALHDFQKFASVDRALQQDRLVRIQSPQQGFRSTARPASLADDFESFLAGESHQPAPPPLQAPAPPPSCAQDEARRLRNSLTPSSLRDQIFVDKAFCYGSGALRAHHLDRLLKSCAMAENFFSVPVQDIFAAHLEKDDYPFQAALHVYQRYIRLRNDWPRDTYIADDLLVPNPVHYDGPDGYREYCRRVSNTVVQVLDGQQMRGERARSTYEGRTLDRILRERL